MSKDLQKAQSTSQTLMTTFKAELQKVVPYLQTLLGSDEMVDRFVKMTHLALMRDQKLLQANQKSLLLALIWCAYRDMEPGVEDGVWLVPFKGMVTPIPAYKGLIKRATSTDSVKNVTARPIYQHDTFKFQYGLEENLVHVPAFGPEKGELIGAYAVFILPDGSKHFHVMARAEIEKIRNSSAAWKAAPNSGPWKEWEEPMFLKTVIKQGFRTIPVKDKLRELIRDDNKLEVGTTIESLLQEAGQELPELPEETPEPEKEEALDTSKFDKLVEEKFATIKEAEEYKRQYHLLQTFLETTAAGQKKKMTVPQLKVMAAGMFDSFWDAFEKYMAKQTPPAESKETKEPPKEEPPKEPPKEEPPKEKEEPPKEPPKETETKETETETPGKTETSGQQESLWTGDGDGDPKASGNDVEAGQDPEERSRFLARRQAAWNKVIELLIPLELLKEIDIHEIESITPENIDHFEELVNNYQPPKKGKK